MRVRGLLRFISVLVVLALVLAGADRVANLVAEHKAAQALGATVGSDPDVDIGGFPFLTQWAAGDFHAVTVSADHATFDDMRVSDVRLRLRDVRTPPYVRSGDDIAGAKAGSVRMSAVVPYGQLPLPRGVTAKRASKPKDEIKVTGTVGILGAGVRINALLKLSTRHGKARLTPDRVKVLGPLPSQAITSLIRRHLTLTVDPPGLPAGLHVTSFAVADTGVRVRAAGSDVGLPRRP